MSYSQKLLIELCKAGKVPGESGVPEHIETVISNVFLFEEKAYKIYKDDNIFFNTNFRDLSARKARFQFTRDDFKWNQQLSHELYLELPGVRINENGVVFVDESSAEELVCITKRMPKGSTLIDILMRADLSANACYEIGRQFAEREARFNWIGEIPSESTLDNMQKRYDDIVEWIKGMKEVSEDEKEVYMSQFKQLICRVYEADNAQLSICFDIHSLNAFYVAGTLMPFDTYPPKEEWCFGPRGLNIFRLATDIYALRGEAEFRAVMKGYCESIGRGPFTEETTSILVLYAALIMLPLLYRLGKADSKRQIAAEKYHDFLKHYTSSTLAL